MAFDAGTLKGYLTLTKDQWDRSIAEATKQVNNFGDYVEQNQKKIQGLGIAMTAVGVAITASMAKAIISFRDTGDMLDELAQKTGMSTEKLSGLGYVASLSGVSLEGVSTSVKILSGNMLDAANGNEAAAKKFEALGISVTAADGSLKSADVIIGEVADRFKTMPDGVEKTALAVDVFGRSGQSLIPVLNGGKDSIEALTAKAKELGIVYSEQDAKAAAALDDAHVSLKASVTGLQKEIGSALAPTLTDLETTMTGVVVSAKDWIKDNRDIAGGLVLVTSGVGALATAAGPLLIALPYIKSGLEAVGLSLSSVAAFAGKAVLGLGAFFVGWKAGELIREVTGVDKAIQGVIDKLQITYDEMYKISMQKMGWTEHGQQALFLKDSLIEVARQLDPTVNGLRDAARVIKANKDAYEELHPRLQRIVDGMSDMTGRLAAVKAEAITVPPATKEMMDAVQAIMTTATEQIKQLSLSETDFKIWQLNREHQANLDALTKNRATKEQFATLEHAHSLRLQKIRDDAYTERLKREEKQLEDYRKAKEIEFGDEEAKWIEHSAVLTGLYQDQQQLLYDNMMQRGNWRRDEAVAIQNWRDVELMKVQDWETAQMTAAYNRLQQQKINFQQYQDEVTLIKQLSTDKQEAIENDARDQQAEADKNRIDQHWIDLSNHIDAISKIYQSYVTGLQNLFEAQHKKHLAELDEWYQRELDKINNSNLSNEDRATAINNLNDQMEAKKAALDAQAARREKALAIAQAIANTAVAVTTAIRAAPWPFNIPLIAFAIATGAAQIAAIGGAYNGPGIEGGSTGGGGGGGEGGGVGGGGGTGGQIGGGGGRGPEEYAAGTEGYITPPSTFVVGDPYSPELVQMRGDLSRVQMSITPMGNQSLATEAPPQINLNFTVNAMDAASFKGRFITDISPLIQQAIAAGLITVPRGRVA